MICPQLFLILRTSFREATEPAVILRGDVTVFVLGERLVEGDLRRPKIDVLIGFVGSLRRLSRPVPLHLGLANPARNHSGFSIHWNRTGGPKSFGVLRFGQQKGKVRMLVTEKDLATGCRHSPSRRCLLPGKNKGTREKKVAGVFFLLRLVGDC